MRREIILLLLIALICSPISSQIRGNEIRVSVSLNHDNWQYKTGESCKFTISVYKAENLLKDAVIDYTIQQETNTSEKRDNIVLKDGTAVVNSKSNKPGFVRCEVTAHVNGYDYKGSATAGYNVEKIGPCAEMPEDFMTYWESALSEARKIPLEPKMEIIPSSCTDKVNVYQISFQNIRPGSRTYGILCIPKKEGKYPALLRVPGAGVRAYYGDIETASKGAITLEIGIHGIPVTMSNDYYDKLAQGALNGYWNFNLANIDEFYYKRVFIGALRAVDYICSLDEFNHKQLGVTGSSQGGALSIATGALDKRVTFIAAVHPAMCDHTAFLHQQQGGWPCYFLYNDNPSQADINTSKYYDVVNFARLLNIPGWYSWGYNDNVCSPTSMYAAYNSIKSPKEISLYLQTAHFWYQEQWDEWCKWIWNKMDLQ